MGIDPRVPEGSEFIPRFAHGLLNLVSSLASSYGGWNITFVKDIFILSDALKILNLPPPNLARQDKLVVFHYLW